MPDDALGRARGAGGDPGAGGGRGDGVVASRGGRGLSPSRRSAAAFAGSALAAALAFSTFPAGASPVMRGATVALALLGFALGGLRPGAAALALAALAPLLPALPRLLGDPAGGPVLLVAALATAGAAFARGLSCEPSPLPQSLWKWGGAFLAVAAVSCVSSIVRGETLFFLLRGGAEPLFVNDLWMPAVDRCRDALRGILVFALLLVALDVFARAARDAASRARLLAAASAGALAAFALAALESRLPIRLTVDPWPGIGRHGGTFSDPNALGAGIGFLVPLLVAALFIGGRGTRGIALLALLLSPLVLERSGSRTGLLLLAVAGLAAGAGFVRAGQGRPGRWLTVAGAVVAVAGLVLAAHRFAPRGGSMSVGGLFQRLGSAFSAASIEDLTSHRTLFWRTAFEMMIEEPLSGCGLGGFPYEFPLFYGRHHGPITVTDNATNALLDLGAECGLPGLLLGLAVVVPLLVRALDAALSKKSAAVDAAARAGGAALLGFAAASLTGSHIRFPEVALLASLAAAFLPAPEPEDSGARSFFSDVTPPRRLAFLVAASGAVASLVVLVPTRKPEAAFRAGPWAGLYGWEGIPEKPTHRWMGPRSFRRIGPGERRIVLYLRNERPDGRPVLALADVDGALRQVLSIPAGEARALTVEDIPSTAAALRLRFDPTFVPYRLTGRRDFRELSVVLAAEDASP